jgi:LPXTG-motif cell wall-anchored protein
MKISALKTLAVSILVAGLTVLGFAAPAHAASLVSPSVTSTGAVSGSTNPNPITITATFPTGSAAKAIQVELPTGWSWVTTMTYSSWPGTPGAVTSVSGYTPTVTGDLASGGPLTVTNALLWLNSSGQMAANTTVTITLGAGTVNVGSGTEFIVSSVTGQNPNAVIDQSSVYLNGLAPTPSPTQSSATTAPPATGSALPDTGAADSNWFIFAGVGFVILGAITLAGIQVLRHRKSG